MSSMFKKKGGLAFKPKIPSARPRPAIATSQPQKSINLEPLRTRTLDPTQEESHRDAPVLSPPDSASPADDEITASGQFRPQSTIDTSQQQDVTDASLNATTTSDKKSSTENEAVDSVANASEPNSIQALPERIELTPDLSKSQSTIIPTKDPVAESNSAHEQSSHSVQEDPHTEPVVAITPESSSPALDDTEPIVEKAEPKTKPRRAPAKPKPKPTEGQQQDDGSAPKTKKRTRKSAAATAVQDGDENAEPTQKKPRTRRNTTPGDAKARRTRSVTPEDAEDQVVDLQKLTMADLTNDLRIGKKFSRHDELRERERQKRMRSKSKDNSEEATEDADTSQTSNTGSSQPPQAPTSNSDNSGGQGSGVQFRIVDGQIVLDQSSLVVDRHARAAANQGDMETIEENDFTRLITSSSFMTTSKLKGPNIWSTDDTERFYHGLRMFGTDFQMIAAMFPGKQRRHVKLKYNREERHAPQLIDAALLGEKSVKMNLDEYRAATGAVFETVESIEAEHSKIQEDFEAEQQRIADEQEAVMRRKRDELFADDNNNAGAALDDEGVVKKKKKSKKRMMEESGAYGDIEIVEEM